MCVSYECGVVLLLAVRRDSAASSPSGCARCFLLTVLVVYLLMVSTFSIGLKFVRFYLLFFSKFGGPWYFDF